MIRFSPYHGLMMILLVLLFIGFWVGVAFLVRALIQGRRPSAVTPPLAAGPDPLHILDERLARGEIDPVEYAERRCLIAGGDAR